MKTTDSTAELSERLLEIRTLCPELRMGQILATIGALAEDETGRSLAEIEDGDFAAAAERFVADLARSRAN